MCPTRLYIRSQMPNGALLQQFDYVGGANQKWRLVLSGFDKQHLKKRTQSASSFGKFGFVS